MGEKNILTLLWYYIKQHRKSIIVAFMFAAIFAAVFSLYRLEVEAVIYAVALCMSVGFVFFIYDFSLYCKKHLLLTELKNRIILDLEALPSPSNLFEQDYDELLRLVHNEKIRIITENDSEKSSTIDYYTLWAHQIKTPIAAMRLLLQSNESDENKELLTELFKTEQYVEMVLSYLRLDSNFTDFVIKQYSLNSIVKQAVRKYAPLFIRKKISLEMDDLDCKVITDEKWLCFVIEQVLSNALKYTSKGKISIYMSKSNSKTLVITDTGIGIAADDLPRICEKGFTGYNGRSDKKATGIGLYLCKRVLNKLSHTITIKSEISSYTTVEIGLDNPN